MTGSCFPLSGSLPKNRPLKHVELRQQVEGFRDADVLYGGSDLEELLDLVQEFLRHPALTRDFEINQAPLLFDLFETSSFAAERHRLSGRQREGR